MDPIAKRLRQSEARFDPHGYYSDVPRAFRNAVWRFLDSIDPTGLSDEMRELREGLMFACRPRRKGRPRGGRVWRLTLPPEVERRPNIRKGQ